MNIALEEEEAGEVEEILAFVVAEVGSGWELVQEGVDCWVEEEG